MPGWMDGTRHACRHLHPDGFQTRRKEACHGEIQYTQPTPVAVPMVAMCLWSLDARVQLVRCTLRRMAQFGSALGEMTGRLEMVFLHKRH